MRLLLLIPPLLFVVLQWRGIDHEFVWVDRGEIQRGGVIRPVDQLGAVFLQPLFEVEGPFRTRGWTQPYYRPLQVATASLVSHRYGREPPAFRRVSLVLGTLTMGLFGLFALRLFGHAAPAALAAAVLAVHPVGIEAWHWISGLSAALVGLWLVTAVWAGVESTRAASLGGRVGLGLLSLALMVLGLTSKESAVMIPALIALCAFCLGVRLPGREPAARVSLPTAAAVVGTQLVLALLFLLAWKPRFTGSVTTGMPYLENSFTTQIWSAIAHWPVSFGWLFFPLHSNTSDAIRLVRTPADPMVWLGLALALGSALAAPWLLLRGERIAVLALAWIWLAFLPTSGLMPLLHPGTVRNLFVPSFGAALLWPALGGFLLRRLAPRAPAALAAGLALALVLGFASRTWARLPDWHDNITLFERDVTRDPHHREGRMHLAQALMEAGRFEEAQAHLTLLLEQERGFGDWASYVNYTGIYQLYCVANRKLGRPEDTVRLFDTALAGDIRQTARLPAFFGCAAGALEAVGRDEEALRAYRMLYEGAARGAAEFAMGAARCAARMGRAQHARAWFGRVPPGVRREPNLRDEYDETQRLVQAASEAEG